MHMHVHMLRHMHRHGHRHMHIQMHMPMHMQVVFAFGGIYLAASIAGAGTGLSEVVLTGFVGLLVVACATVVGSPAPPHPDQFL